MFKIKDNFLKKEDYLLLNNKLISTNFPWYLIKESTKESNEMTVVVKDLSGKVVQSHAIIANVGTNEVYVSTEALTAGAYFVTLSDGTSSKTMQLIRR
jgi:hypothetical protein